MSLPWLVLLLVPLAIMVLDRRRRRDDRRCRGEAAMREVPRILRRHYSRRNFLRLGWAVGGSAILVYGGVDARVDRWHAEHVRGPASDAIAHVARFLGERPWFLYFALFSLIDACWTSNRVTLWGRRCFDAMLIGLPALWGVQRGLGASRPLEVPHGPRYRPLADDNSASGHTFMAAIPFLVAAHMSGHRPARGIAYALSPLTGWSRINDRKHYLSQVALGYGLAWQAVDTVMAEATAEQGGSMATGPDTPEAGAPS